MPPAWVRVSPHEALQCLQHLQAAQVSSEYGGTADDAQVTLLLHVVPRHTRKASLQDVQRLGSMLHQCNGSPLLKGEVLCVEVLLSSPPGNGSDDGTSALTDALSQWCMCTPSSTWASMRSYGSNPGCASRWPTSCASHCAGLAPVCVEGASAQLVQEDSASAIPQNVLHAAALQPTLWVARSGVPGPPILIPGSAQWHAEGWMDAVQGTMLPSALYALCAAARQPALYTGLPQGALVTTVPLAALQATRTSFRAEEASTAADEAAMQWLSEPGGLHCLKAVQDVRPGTLFVAVVHIRRHGCCQAFGGSMPGAAQDALHVTSELLAACALHGAFGRACAVLDMGECDMPSLRAPALWDLRTCAQEHPLLDVARDAGATWDALPKAAAQYVQTPNVAGVDIVAAEAVGASALRALRAAVQWCATHCTDTETPDSV